MGQPGSLEFDRDTMGRMGHEVVDLVAEHLASLREQPAFTTLDRASTRAMLGGDAPSEGRPFADILREFAERVSPYHAREPHPRFLGYIPSCPSYAGVMGDWLATGFNFFAGVWSVAAAPNEVEVTVLDWFRRWMGLPEGAFGLLTSGGSAATLGAVVAARHAATEAGAELSRLTAYCSDQSHSSFARATWIAGVPRENVRLIGTDQEFRLRVSLLRDAIRADRAAGKHPFVICATAGATNTGAVDPLHELADLAADEGVWLHADAAYAGFAVLTDTGRRLLDGLGRADSITLDPHKWLYVPFECGCLLVRDPERLAAAFAVHPEYLRDVQGRDAEVNFADYGEQLTRYSRALKVWFAVKCHGTAAIAAAQRAAMELAELAEQIVGESPELEVLSRAQFGIVCFRAHPGGMESPEALDALNEEVNRRVNATGFVLMSSTRLAGRLSLRLCVPGYRTTEADIRAVIELVRATVREVAAAART